MVGMFRAAIELLETTERYSEDFLSDPVIEKAKALRIAYEDLGAC